MDLLDVCKICLSAAPDKNIYQLETSEKDGDKSYLEILDFCLEIQVTEDSKITKKICTKCFNKVLKFYKFKTMALKNDAYLKSLRSLSSEVRIKLASEQFYEDEVLVEPNVSFEPVETNNIEIKNECQYKVEYLEYDEFIEDNVYTQGGLDNEKKQTDCLVDTRASSKDADHAQKSLETETYTLDSSANEIQNKPPRNPRKRTIRVNPIKLKCKKDSGKSAKDITNDDIPSTPGICEQCGANVKNLKLHSHSHIPIEKRKRYECEDCEKTFVTRQALNTHRKIKHLGKLWHCDLCNEDVKDLTYHRNTVHEKSKLPFLCSVCDMRFPYQSNYDVHVSVHTKEKAYQCDHCGKNFRLKVLLKNHVLSVHEKVRNFACPVCPKSFFKKYHYVMHMRTHTKEKPHKCECCDKCFVSVTAAKQHQLSSHSDTKDYHCKLCSSSFSRSSTLYMHMRAHRKERPYACRHCGVHYARTYDRNKHERKHHDGTAETPGDVTATETTT